MEYHEDERWMTIKEAAGYIGVSTSFLRKHLRRVPHARAGDKVLRFRKADLDNWLERNGSGGELAYLKNNGR